MEQGKGQRETGFHTVEIEAVAPVDLQKWPQGEEAEGERSPHPDRKAFAVDKRAQQRQGKGGPPQEDGVDVAEARLQMAGQRPVHEDLAQVGHQIAAEERMHHRGREPAQQVHAQRDRLTPSLQRKVIGQKLVKDRHQHRRPEGEGDDADEEQGGKCVEEGARGEGRDADCELRIAGCELRQRSVNAQLLTAICYLLTAICYLLTHHNDNDDNGENRQEDGGDHLGEAIEGEEDARQDGRFAPT